MNPGDFHVVETTSADIETIRQIHCDAFGYDKEARLTEQLLGDPTAEPRVSLLAFHSGKPVGHILFTRASFRGTDEPGMIHILAPLAVVREYQRQGVGGVLIREGLKRLKAMGSLAVFVLGHKEYYPKYGFKPHASRRGFETPYPMPDELGEYWMYQFLSPEAEELEGGAIQCAHTLDRPEHWRDDENDR